MASKCLFNCNGLQVRAANNRDTLDCEVRFTAPTDTGEIEGVAVRFNTVDTYRTEFAPDAFRGLEGRTLPMLWAHDPANVIGSWSSFSVRSDGLTAKGKLNLAVAKAQEVRSLLQAGDIKGLSIGFRTVKDERRANGVRRIVEARLHEISIVAFPSVPGSGITSVRFDNPGLSAFIAAARAASKTLKG
ncbi:HK97 family phage prohead protease [Phyllobacterium phragmitis]|uniref:HK97 family phage prohead protease n=1 Tax=Phyllobacterium phragmitis TaxID=2670329 RepID=A0ABQ0GYK5_9HYPH